MDDDLLFAPEVSKFLRVPEPTLRYWAHRGEGPKSFRMGRRRVWKRSDVAAWLEAQYQAAQKEPA